MSAHIAIRCDECGQNFIGDASDGIGIARKLAGFRGWRRFEAEDHDICPFCIAKRKARERAEASNAAS